MIDNPDPKTWQDLQKNVCKIFNEIGLDAEIGKKAKTPRGEVELDVFAIDQYSVDKIEYIVECKNWNKKVPQEKVHAFTTVMHEVGANIGFIISKKGLQKGAEKYTRNTNIQGLTFSEFQQRYLNMWWIRYFIPKIRDASDSLSQYLEPFNSCLTRALGQLSPSDKNKFLKLSEEYQPYFTLITIFDMYVSPFGYLGKMPSNLDESITFMERILKGNYRFTSNCFRSLLDEIINLFNNKTKEFNEFFEKDIFKDRK